MRDEKLTIRRADFADAPVIFDMIKELAVYEEMLDEVTGDEKMLENNMKSGLVHAFVAEYDGNVAAFALYFFNYSTFKSKPGLYLEDIFVRPSYRKKGIGKELFSMLEKEAVRLDCGRMEWCCLNWNEPSIAFYRHMGAKPMDEWTTWRLDEETLLENGKEE